MGKVVEFSRAIGPRASKPLWRHVLGEVLREERLVQERILTEVAAAAGVSPQYLSEIERGRKEPSSEILGSVADALELELFDVVHRVGERLGARLDVERREAERRERLLVEASFAFRADVVPGHPLDLTGADAAGTIVLAGATLAAPADVFLLAA
jgi:transcriptional regulator with XRE-family HTH domain